jgi:hypothetical protein
VRVRTVLLKKRISFNIQHKKRKKLSKNCGGVDKTNQNIYHYYLEVSFNQKRSSIMDTLKLKLMEMSYQLPIVPIVVVPEEIPPQSTQSQEVCKDKAAHAEKV